VSERPVLDAVLLDAGGTIGRLDFEWIAEAVTAHGIPVDPRTLRVAEVEGRRGYDASARAHVAAEGEPAPGEESPPLGGAGSVHAYFGGMLEAAGVPATRLGEVIDVLLDRQGGPGRSGVGLWARPMEGAREALAGLAALGLRRAVVSNSDGRAAEHIASWGLLEGLEFVVDSHVVGIEKPDPRIFQVALERMGVAPERALYVGDIRCVDEVGSRRAGMHFVLIDPTRGAYAAPDSPWIAEIAALPEWIGSHFTCPHEAARSPRGAR
jgi:putative hydrolase of the HAD superfamily